MDRQVEDRAKEDEAWAADRMEEQRRATFPEAFPEYWEEQKAKEKEREAEQDG